MDEENFMTFGLSEKKTSTYERYIGKWIIIYPSGRQENFSGLLTRVEDGYGILNPFQGGEFDPEKGLTRKLINDDAIVFLQGAHIEPITKESLEASCTFSNQQNKQKRKGKKN